ncbi:MAG: pyridoxal phosphate-dependent aminotransferase [Candidatus Jettenia sp.]|uniref:Aminotransferase n=1 Tax=Candidatus Jettenia caeni TaxID=247490 RepID=I3ILW7_9BACT|nr:pyridoxal phosphate-dependent aminotransferase [Candidatus Jettenia sp. AMX1]MBC6928120.1 pyridoxal phosphate-dependent aminotransferase [Candidatus Jettenia sp.]WKZ14472.1 MAG: pyridoxal phosphate-dependent aminotransferase [Candidatus Jettenia caeni]KAA0249469.1 MAG: pyridoxal phosphate-dependent aminotransferase [Candidatus Jettenia sp. AMX1]MCE7879212.1 pyridoxal phosphate-dependent aminotransferase [Candidatus Jettenia sp. AMX1]MCQ3925971.1 pyridoxal phosphate-dependent aminotransferas
MIAHRMSKLDSSGIRKVFDLAQKMQNPVNLSIGQPDFDVPEEIKTEAIKAIGNGANKYTVTQGIPELRNALLKQLQKRRKVDAESIMITSGVSGALTLAFMVLINPEDEVIIPDPSFVSYKHLTHFCGGKPVFVDTYPDFKLTVERIQPCITKRTKILILNSPANPTGVMYTTQEIKEIAELAKKHNVFIISDEIYHDYDYNHEFDSIGRYYKNTLILDGFSKSFAMTGWRMGFAAGPASIVNEMIKLQQYTFVCAPSFAQYAISKSLETDLSKYIASYERKRDLMYDGLKDTYQMVKPGGAFYFFPQVPWGTDEEFVTAAIQKNLLIIPGSVFSERHTHFRISYAASDETIERGIDILKSLARQ